MLPTNFLRQIIGLYGDALQSVVPGYLEASMETFKRNQEKMRAAFGTEKAMQTFETMARSNMEWFEQAMRMFAPVQGGKGAPGPGERAEPPGAAESRPQPGSDLETLQRQLRAMQEQLEQLRDQAPADSAPESTDPEGSAEGAPRPRQKKTSRSRG